jgi:hypothetical protein
MATTSAQPEPMTLAAPEEIEALLIAVNDRLDALGDEDLRALLRRGRERLERQLADLLAA